MDKPLDNPPAKLKALAPFVQRANELRTADKVMSYYCCFRAVELGIPIKTEGVDESRVYLNRLMDTLEALRSQLADNDAVSNQTAGAAYVENFALKVFAAADNEDRSGRATRATAKNFLAASHFLELLNVFGKIEPEMREKIKYAKWKAADIAKAFREGRKPQSGPAGGDAKEEAAAIESAMAPNPIDSKEEEEYLAREMAKLQAPEPDKLTTEPKALSPGSQHGEDDILATASSMSRSSSSSKARLSMNLDGGALSPNFSKPLNAQVPRSGSYSSQEARPEDTAGVSSAGAPPSLPPPIGSGGSEDGWKHAVVDQSTIAPFGSASDSNHGFVGSAATSPGSRPLPVPPQRDGLPIPPVSAHQQVNGSSPDGSGGPIQGPGNPPASFWGTEEGDSDAHVSLPSVPFGVPSASRSSSYSGHPAIQRIDPVLPSAPSFPDNSFADAPPTRLAASQLPVISSARASPAVVPAPTPSLTTANPESLPANLSTRVQKLAKGAASAVDFEDLDTARIQLRQALDILEGRTTS